MKYFLPADKLYQLSEFLSKATALYFPKDQWHNLEQKIISAAKEFDFTDAVKFIDWLVTRHLNINEMEILTSHLTTTETYFWRENDVFNALEKNILPELIRSRQNKEKNIRIWSAGCSTGEEPYSIAMALHRTIQNIKEWNITLLATDINPRILRKAQRGSYGKWSFRGVPDWLINDYFISDGKGAYELLPEIKKMVDFQYLNLAECSFPSPLNNTNAMDIIFCRNVMMYFSPEKSEQVSNAFSHSLIDNGHFIVSSSELSFPFLSRFRTVNFPNSIVYQKDHNKTLPEKAIYEPIKGHVKTQQIPIRKTTIIKPVKYEEPAIKRTVSNITRIAVPQKTNYEAALELYTKGSYNEAVQRLENSHSSEEIILKIRSLANLGKLKESAAICEQAIFNDKLNPKLYYLLAVILQEHNQVNESIIALKRVIYLDPDFVLSYYTLGNIYYRIGNSISANKCFTNVLSIINRVDAETIIPESEGLTAGRLKDIVSQTINIGVFDEE